MDSSQTCPQCGAVVAKDAAWCGKCGFSRSAPAGSSIVQAGSPNPAVTEPLAGLRHAHGVIAVAQGEGINATGYGGIFDQRGSVVALLSSIDHQGAKAAPVFVERGRTNTGDV